MRDVIVLVSLLLWRMSQLGVHAFLCNTMLIYMMYSIYANSIGGIMISMLA